MIYGRFGELVELVRMGTLKDVTTLDNRTPDKQDREAVAQGSYVVTRTMRGGHATGEEEIGQERLHHLAFLRADKGLSEIMDAIEALKAGGK